MSNTRGFFKGKVSTEVEDTKNELFKMVNKIGVTATISALQAVCYRISLIDKSEEFDIAAKALDALYEDLKMEKEQ